MYTEHVILCKYTYSPCTLTERTQGIIVVCICNVHWTCNPHKSVWRNNLALYYLSISRWLCPKFRSVHAVTVGCSHTWNSSLWRRGTVGAARRHGPRLCSALWNTRCNKENSPGKWVHPKAQFVNKQALLEGWTNVVCEAWIKGNPGYNIRGVGWNFFSHYPIIPSFHMFSPHHVCFLQGSVLFIILFIIIIKSERDGEREKWWERECVFVFPMHSLRCRYT